MAITFHIPGPLRPYADGRARVQLDASPSTLGEALAALWLAHPALRDRVLTEQGDLRQHIHLFVGNDDARYRQGSLTPVPAGAEITILPSVSGG